jgi:RNA polymerase sigma-70 factor (ECF subfamily)
MLRCIKSPGTPFVNDTRTTTALLDLLLDPSNDGVWREFDARYRPVLEALGRRVGLSDDDAADVAQETLTRFLHDYLAHKYDRSRGRLGAWLTGIARHRIAELRRVRARRRERRGESAIVELPGANELAELWDQACRQEVLRRAMDELRRSTRFDDTTIRAFERVALEQRPAAEVARELNLSVDSVYAAKSRCMAQLREILSELEHAYEAI